MVASLYVLGSARLAQRTRITLATLHAHDTLTEHVPRSLVAPCAPGMHAARSATATAAHRVACNRECVVQVYIYPFMGLIQSVVDPISFLHGISYL